MLDLFALSGPLKITLLILVFVVVVAGVVLASNAWVTRTVARSRLDEVKGAANPNALQSSLRGEAINSGWARMTELIERTGVSLVDTKGETLRAKLIAAGYSSPIAPKVFTAVRLLLIILLPGAMVSIMLIGPEPASALKLYVVGVIFAVMGLYLPNLWISAKADRRRQAIINGFPDSLDLMLVCVEAGLGMESAFDRVGREMVQSHPLVARMLSLVTMELRAGATREEALHNMADRANVAEIRSFSTLLIQSDKLGSSVGETLRVYATEMREKRRMRAEEKAHRLPVLLSIPLVVCMLPVMVGVLMLPAAIRVIREMLPVMLG